MGPSWILFITRTQKGQHVSNEKQARGVFTTLSDAVYLKVARV